MRIYSCVLLTAAVLATLHQAHAASQTWTNAPADANWPNTNNWIAHAAPGCPEL